MNDFLSPDSLENTCFSKRFRIQSLNFQKINYPTLLIIFFILLVAFICISAPLSNNPDGNFIFGIALKLSEGKITEAFEPLYLSALPVLMAPFVSIGMSLFSAYRSVNFFAFALLFLSLHRICRILSLRPYEHIFVLLITGIHLSYFTVVIISSDFLASSFSVAAVSFLIDRKFIWSLKTRLVTSLFVTLSYFAKPPQLPIFILSIAILGAIRVFSKDTNKRLVFKAYIQLIAITLVLCLPWILTLSLSFDRFLIGGQQLVNQGIVSLESYSPLSPISLLSGGAGSQYGFLVNSFNTLVFSSDYLFRTTSDLLFGDLALGIMILLVIYSLLSVQCISKEFTLYVFIVIQLFSYLFFWGPYFRYYMPVYPFFVIAAVLGASSIVERVSKAKFRLKVGGLTFIHLLTLSTFGISFFSIAYHSASSIISDWSSKDDKVISCALLNENVRRSEEVITGNVFSPYPGLIAYSLKKTFWNSLRPQILSSPENLLSLLGKWKVGTIIWEGGTPSVFQETSELVLEDTFGCDGKNFSIYSIKFFVAPYSPKSE